MESGAVGRGRLRPLDFEGRLSRISQDVLFNSLSDFVDSNSFSDLVFLLIRVWMEEESIFVDFW